MLSAILAMTVDDKLTIEIILTIVIIFLLLFSYWGPGRRP